MRPQFLYPLFEPLTSLPGIGPKLAPLLARAIGGERVLDLLFHLPSGVINRQIKANVAQTEPGERVTLELWIDAHLPPGPPRRGRGGASFQEPYRVRARDETGFITLAWFHAFGDYLNRQVPEGSRRIISGEVSLYKGERRILHPDYICDPDQGQSPPETEPVYPLTQGVSLRQMQKAIGAALAHLPSFVEWIDQGLRDKHGWPDFVSALRALHQPDDPQALLPQSPARMRLGYDELFLRQMALGLRRAAREREPGLARVGDGRFARALLQGLPFTPTGAQLRADGEIAADLARPHPMLRLLQGDVGAGKTLVAALAMARMAEAGGQSALMAPTELLASQHARNLAPLLAKAGLKVALLSGKLRAGDKRRVLDGLIDGSVQIVCGTHALFQDNVLFADLGLVVVDEQHRFGVSDRARLVNKGRTPHVLMMSATPIPRTLALAALGDMDMSILDEKPAGRQPIRTVAIGMDRLPETLEALRRAIAKGERIYWVCPQIDGDELDPQVAAAVGRRDMLEAALGQPVELIHGRMPLASRETSMRRFVAGAAPILVATTVIEVGVDVPEATVIVIEAADRFGLAQLHQLRGRVGRGDKPSSCLLLFEPPLGELARARLDALRNSQDGFAIAALDYEQRGAGDVLGLRQSGLPRLRLADMSVHKDFLLAADHDARLALSRDRSLEGPRGVAIRAGLHLFDLGPEADSARAG